MGDWAIDLGRKFKAPKATSKSQWAMIKFLVEHGFVFQSVRDGEAGQHVSYPETIEAARDFVARYADQAIRVPPPPS